MGQRIPYYGGPVDFSFSIWNNPSGNLFVMASAQLVDVKYFNGYDNEGKQEYRFTLNEDGIRFLKGGFSFVRTEFFEDVVKAKFWGMAWRDAASMRLLSNPIWLDDERRIK